MSKTVDLSNQFAVLFEKIEIMTDSLKRLEQQNSILFKKVEKIENYFAGTFHNKNKSNFDVETDEESEKKKIEKDNKKKENHQKKNKKLNKKDPIKDTLIREDLFKNTAPIKESTKSVNNEDFIQDTPNESTEIKSDEKEIKSDEKEIKFDENEIKSDENEIKFDDTKIKPEEPMNAKEGKAPRFNNENTKISQKNENKKELSNEAIKKLQNDMGFKVGFMGEGYVYEHLLHLGCFSKIKWNAHTNNQHNPCITLNNGHKYYIHGDGEHYDILATDKGGKKYYIEIKSTSMSRKSNQINPLQEQLRSNLSYNVRHFILAKVKNVLNNPSIEYQLFNPLTGYRVIDVNCEHTDEYFIKSLFQQETIENPNENSENKAVAKTKNNIVIPNVKNNKRNKK